MLKSGFIEYVNGNETKKLFFHISDLVDNQTADGNNSLKVGDEVEFAVSHGSRNGKQAAIKIKKLQSANQASASNTASNATETTTGVNATDLTETGVKRPERLNLKIKIANIDDESGKQLILIRQPVNPDAKSKSFNKVLKERAPGFFIE